MDDPGSVRVTFNLSADAWALLERAIDGARHLAGDTLNDSEVLEAVARDAIAQQNDQPERATRAPRSSSTPARNARRTSSTPGPVRSSWMRRAAQRSLAVRR